MEQGWGGGSEAEEPKVPFDQGGGLKENRSSNEDDRKVQRILDEGVTGDLLSKSGKTPGNPFHTLPFRKHRAKPIRTARTAGRRGSHVGPVIP